MSLKGAGHGAVVQRVTGCGVCTEVLVAGCASFVNSKREEGKKFSSMNGLHDAFLTPSSAHV